MSGAACAILCSIMPNAIRKHYAPGDTPVDRVRRTDQRRSDYDDRRRDDPVRKFYMSGKWRVFAKAFLARSPVCRGCGGQANQVDHIKSVRHHWSLRFTPVNLQPLCQRCHSAKTAKESFKSIECMS